MSETRYLTLPEGNKFSVYREKRYDDGRFRRVFIESFEFEAHAESLAETLNQEED